MRAFIGIRIPKDDKISERLNHLKRIEGVKTVEENNLHINLKFLGEITEGQVEKIVAVMDSIGRGPFKIKLKGISVFPKPEFIKVIWVGAESDKLPAIFHHIEEGLEKIGFGKERREFTPHITIARVKRKTKEDLSLMISDEEFGEYEISSIELIKSELTPSGPAYSTIHKVQL